MLLLIPPMRRCNNLCISALFVLWYYHCMDVVFDWNLGNMIYSGHNTLRLCGFPFAEIRSLQLVSEPYLTIGRNPQKWTIEYDVNGPSFDYIPTLHLLLCKAHLLIDLLTPISLKHADGNKRRMAASRTAASGPRQAYLRPMWARGFCTDPLSSSHHVRSPWRDCQGHLHREVSSGRRNRRTGCQNSRISAAVYELE